MNKDRLLNDVIAELKKDNYSKWRYFKNDTAEGYSQIPRLIDVMVYRKVGPKGGTCYILEVEDLENGEKTAYQRSRVKSLYQHLEAQRLEDEKTLDNHTKTQKRHPTNTSRPEVTLKAARETYLLERLLEALKEI